MARIQPLTIDTAPAESQPVLEKIKTKFGKVPNIFATLACSPAALKSLMGIFGALETGNLDAVTGEAIALRIGQKNSCQYCTAAHTAKAKMAGATTDDAIGFRKGTASDAKTQAIIDFAELVLEKGGHLSDDEIQKVRDAGLGDADIFEILTIIVCNIFTNGINALAKTDVDFPAAPEID